MEMNTRIQVEHPITEMITGVDLVKQQLKIASGEKLELLQKDIKIHGHAIECRINAEDPKKDFMPCPGIVKELYMPGGPGIRIDSAIYSGYKIPHCYDSMVCKIIAYAPTRNETINKMKRALSEFVVGGIKTNIDFQYSLLEMEEVVKGEYDTSFLGKKMVKINA